MSEINWEKLLKTDIVFLKKKLTKLQLTTDPEQKATIIEEIIKFWEKRNHSLN